MPNTLLIALLQRFLNEVHLSSLLHNIDINVVSLMGVYSTETHPFGLVYEYADGLDLRQYLRSEPDAERLKLVLPLSHSRPFLVR